MAAGDQLRRLIEKQVVQLWAVEAPQFEDIPKPRGRDQSSVGTSALEDGVGGHRRSVSYVIDFVARRARLLQQVVDGVSDGALEIRRCRRDLVGVDAAGLIQQNYVGKGAADVGGDAYSVRG